MSRLVVITGPSGVGKGTLIAELLGSVEGLVCSVSATTRHPRPGEVDGRDYHFLDDEQFRNALVNGEFLEWAEYAGHSYGTLRSELDRHAAAKGVVLEIEIVGARQVRASDPDAILIFISPPDWETLESRLRARGTDSPEQIDLRLAQAAGEMAARDEFDTVIVNDDLRDAANRLVEAVRSRLD